MTAIIGLVDADGTVYMGGDSAGTTSQGDQSVLANQKVFFPELGPWFVIGCCGTFRLAQVLKYSFQPPRPPAKDVELEGFMATTFVEAVKECFRETGIMNTEPGGAESGHSFLVGYQGRVFKIEDNFQVLYDAKNYTAIGTGEAVAMGALFASEGLAKADERVMLALRAAAYYNAMVREPFSLYALEFDKNWYRDLKFPKSPKRKNVKKRRQ